MKLFSTVLLMTVLCVHVYAQSKGDVLRKADDRFKIAATQFNGAEDDAIKVINGGEGNVRDTPRQDENSSFMKPDETSGEMICFNSTTGKIVAAHSPIVGNDFYPELRSRVQDELVKSTTGKIDFETRTDAKDPNTNKQMSENKLIVAWSGKVLTGNAQSKLICTIKSKDLA